MKYGLTLAIAIAALLGCNLAYAAEGSDNKAQPTAAKPAPAQPAQAKPAAVEPAPATPAPVLPAGTASAVPVTQAKAAEAPAAAPASKMMAHNTEQKNGKARPKNLDLRHCLDLQGYAAIAKCAGE